MLYMSLTRKRKDTLFFCDGATAVMTCFIGPGEEREQYGLVVAVKNKTVYFGLGIFLPRHPNDLLPAHKCDAQKMWNSVSV